MPVVDYEMRVSSRFACPTPESASPSEKTRHMLPRVYDVKTPHCSVDVIISTRRVMVDKTDVNFYQGHVPDAPVLLSPELSAQYAAGAKATGWSFKRAVAFGAALATGAAIGAIAVSGVLSVVSLLHWCNPLIIVAPSAHDWMIGLIAWSAAGAVMALVSDWRDWAVARTTFRHMQAMSDCAVRFEQGLAKPTDVDDAGRLIKLHESGSSWILQQAAIELELAKEKHLKGQATKAA